MVTPYDADGYWRLVAAQIKTALDATEGLREAFLADHARQATDVGVQFLRTVPEGTDVNLAGAVASLGEQVDAHTRFLCSVADLDDSQAERLLSASQGGYGQFLRAFRSAMDGDQGQTMEQILTRIEMTLMAHA